MKKTILLIAIFIGFISCSVSDTEEENRILTGKFTEIKPLNGRTILEFTSQSKLVQTFIDIDIILTYTIRLLNENQLELSCNECDESQSKIVLYQIIDNNKFEIGGFYPANLTEKMTFQRN